MFEALIIILLVGGALAFAGVYCLAGAALPGYRWYNRVAVVLLVSPCVTWVAILWMAVWLRTGLSVNLVGVALFSLIFGIPMIVILSQSIKALVRGAPFVDKPSLARGIWFMPQGLAVQLIPSALTLVGVQT